MAGAHFVAQGRGDDMARRITATTDQLGLDEATTIVKGDYIPIDNATLGTRKISKTLKNMETDRKNFSCFTYKITTAQT